MQPEPFQISLQEVGENPLQTLTSSRDVSFGAMNDAQRKVLEQALAKGQVGLCGYKANVSVARGIKTEFVVQESGCIVFHEHIFLDRALVELHLRHAVELVLWFQLCSGDLTEAQRIAIALLSAHAATKFYLQMPLAERERIIEEIPGWLRTCVGAFETETEARFLHELSLHIEALLLLQGGSGKGLSQIEEAIRIAVRFVAIANPTEFILTQQGDERLLIDPATGLNKYGCSPRPRPEAITFSSCTASSVSEYAFREAEMLRHRLMKMLVLGSPVAQYDSEMENVREGLKQLLDLEALETEVIICSSGSDAELYPLFFLRSEKNKKIVNIVVGPDEVGSGTVFASGGRHFSVRTPLGKKVKPNDAIAGIDADSIEVIGIPIRGSAGAGLTQDELKQHIVEAVENAGDTANAIILHIVDNTKTGLLAPDVEFVLGLLETVGHKLQVVVDACQFRLEKANLYRYLKHGFCVMITGSKFFTGPPFCGALFIPPEINVRGDGSMLPAGFVDYFTKSEVPAVLKPQAEHLSSALNLGLLFRWVGALKEMKSYYCVPSAQRTTILQTFRCELIASIRENTDLHLLDCPLPKRWKDADETLWDAQPTIFSFAVRDPEHPGKWLRVRELRKIYYLLNRDCAEGLPASASEAERKLAAQRCHIGQPVTIARCNEYGETGALRIACGARLVYGITYDATLGKTPVERFQRELNDARSVLAKVSLILKYWPDLENA